MKKVLLVLGIVLGGLLLVTQPALAAPPADSDGDGYKSNQDCDDSDPYINPGAIEVCDGLDNDCDGAIDEDGVCDSTCPDADGDGYTDAACGGTDCNDSNPAINPGAAETCGDGIDQDCDGSDLSCTDPHAALLWSDYPANCQNCHGTQFNEMNASLHYQWIGSAPDMVNQPSAEQGKLTNAVNSYCVNILGDWPVCGSCHVGRGLRPDDPNAGLENIDCLMCHNADYTLARTRLSDGSMGPPAGTDQATLDGYVRGVGAPTRISCLKCHANAGGGDGVKRGDLSMADADNSDSNFDVHMNTVGANLACQSCHAFVSHKVTGKGSDLRATDYASEVKCVTCHTGMDSGTGHQDAGANRTDADRHVSRVSCQACHIIEYGKVATEIHRDWEFHHDGSPADGASGPGHPHTEKLANLTPELLFWDRTSDNYLLGDDAALTYDAAKGTYPTSRPIGDINNGKIYPFKYKTAYQPMVISDNALIALDTFEYLKVSGDLATAVENGLVNMGYPSSEPYTMVTTDTYALLNHGIPAAAAVDCAQCHESNFGYDTQSKLDRLGYQLKDLPSLICAQCHSEKKWPRDHERIHGHISKGSGMDCYYCHSFTRPERGLCDPCTTTCNDEFVDNNPYPHVCPPPQ